MKADDLSEATVFAGRLDKARVLLDEVKSWTPEKTMNTIYISGGAGFTIHSWPGFDAGERLRDFIVGLILAEIHMLEKRLVQMGVTL